MVNTDVRHNYMPVILFLVLYGVAKVMTKVLLGRWHVARYWSVATFLRTLRCSPADRMLTSLMDAHSCQAFVNE